tara:strand:+ start:477 stop:1181 length:705 start_codon:yes stop_codon:yes gene_type:complete
MASSKEVEIEINNEKFIGKFFHQDSSPRPTVIVFHDWSGRNNFSEDSANKIVAAGFNAFCADLYGEAKVGKTTEEKSALMTPLVEDRKLLKDILLGTLNKVKELDEVDPQKLAAIGFCFGGLCALDLARSGADIKSAVSFHGLLNKPPFANDAIKAKLLVLHGHEDPMVPPQQVTEFKSEMQESHAEWEMLIFGKTLHAFANPEANTPKDGTQYNEYAAMRSWDATLKILKNTL